MFFIGIRGFSISLQRRLDFFDFVFPNGESPHFLLASAFFIFAGCFSTIE